jgi:hypothetical protein
MATVSYVVLYKYIHPSTSNPITNRQTGYDPSSFNIKEISKSNTKELSIEEMPGTVAPSDADQITVNEFVTNRNFPSSKLYDMLFCFDSTKMNSNIVEDETSLGGYGGVKKLKVTNYTDTFKQVNGTPWFIASMHGSLSAAMKAAVPLVKRIGKENVKVMKQVPLEITVHIE